MSDLRTAAHDAVRCFDLIWAWMEQEEPERLTRPGWQVLRMKTDALKEAAALSAPAANLPGGFHSNGPETEQQAAMFVRPRTGTQREAVLNELIKAHPRGLTDDEIGELLPLYVNTGAKRRNDLKNQGWVEDSGERRSTQTGSPAVVWRLSPEALDHLRCHTHLIQ